MEKWKIRFYRNLGHMLLVIGGILMSATFIYDITIMNPGQPMLDTVLKSVMAFCGIGVAISAFALLYYGIQLDQTKDRLVVLNKELAEQYANMPKEFPELYEQMAPKIVDIYKRTTGEEPTQEEVNKLFAEALFRHVKQQEVE